MIFLLFPLNYPRLLFSSVHMLSVLFHCLTICFKDFFQSFLVIYSYYLFHLPAHTFCVQQLLLCCCGFRVFSFLLPSFSVLLFQLGFSSFLLSYSLYLYLYLFHSLHAFFEFYENPPYFFSKVIICEAK